MIDRNAILERHTRWLLLAQDFDIIINHVPRVENALADFLSRPSGSEPPVIAEVRQGFTHSGKYQMHCLKKCAKRDLRLSNPRCRDGSDAN